MRIVEKKINEGRINLGKFEDGIGNRLYVNKMGQFVEFMINNKGVLVNEEMLSEINKVAKKAFKLM